MDLTVSTSVGFPYQHFTSSSMDFCVVYCSGINYCSIIVTVLNLCVVDM